LLHYYFSCHLENNKLDFKDLEDAQFNQETQIYYSPQAQTDLQVEETNSSEIVLTALTSGTGNQYQWYDLDAVLEGETGKSLTINTSQHGDYYCKITNPYFPYLTLTTIPYSNGTSNLTQGVISSEYDALKALYENTDGTGWYQKENWLSDTLVTAWHGIEVNGLHVTELVLYNNNLSGNIPSKIGNLTYLEILSLSDNQLEGDIPQSIGNLEKLEELYLNYNQLSQIPQEISNLINLMYLSFHGNQLTQIPQEIGNLTDLESLSLSDNHLQNLPDLTGLNKLLLLDVYNNNLTFEDIEPNISLEYSFQYAPQAKVGTEQFIYPQEGEPVQLSINVGGTANTYQWYKNKKPIEGDTGHIYTIPAYHEENDKGIYTCKIRNTIATELTLITMNYYVGMESYNINLSAEPSDGGVVEGGGTYVEGSPTKIRAAANEHFKFLHWQENDIVVSTDSIYSFMVDRDRNLVAHFKNVTGIIQKSAGVSLPVFITATPEKSSPQYRIVPSAHHPCQATVS
jgi:Leucine-rich repeat (LRR) protein